MSVNDPKQGPMWTLTGRSVASRRERLRSAIAIVFAALFAASAVRAQEDPWGDNARAAEMARSSETQPSETAASDAGRATDPARESEQKPDDSADDDPEAQAEVEKSAAELEAFAKWLSRSTRYIPMMRKVLEREGLPLDLVYLAMIESGFSAYAYSFAKAAGPWQFVVGTSSRYGLLTDFWVDERRDPAKATVAAAKYLKDLKARFHGDWYLAWAGYNAGEGKISRAIRKEKTTDFWRMMGKGRTLRAETKHYVPKLIAAALIAKHPERFGFRVDYDEPREFEEVRVPDATDLHVLANAAGVTFEEFRDLNPELRRFCTPPGGWTVKLPKGRRETFLAEYTKLDAKDRLSFTEHRVEKGEPLSKIARAYGVRESAILRTNGLKSYRQIKPGRILVIPMAGASRGLLAGTQLEDRRALRRAHGRVTGAAGDAAEKAPASQRRSGTLYTVRPGDTLWRIAAKFSTTVDKLCKLNGLTPRQARALQVGQTLAIRET